MLVCVVILMILVIKDDNDWYKGSNDDVIIPVTYPTLPS